MMKHGLGILPPRSSLRSNEGQGAGGHDDGTHCVECIEAVGVPAGSASASGGGREGGARAVGSDGDIGDVTYSNPYACMLTPEKIQALEGHKNSAIAKRCVCAR